MDDELYVAREKVKGYVKNKKICLNDDVGDRVNSPIDSVKAKGQTSKTNLDKEKVVEYESD